MKEIKDSDLKELRRIQESIPKEIKDQILIEERITPTMADTIPKLLKDKRMTPELREKLTALLDSGIFNQVEQKENPKAIRKLLAFLEREQQKSIKAGRLSQKYDKELQQGV